MFDTFKFQGKEDKRRIASFERPERQNIRRKKLKEIAGTLWEKNWLIKKWEARTG